MHNTNVLKLLMTLCVFLLTTKVSSETIIFGVEDYAPFMYEDERTGEITGLSVEVVKAINSELGVHNPIFSMFRWPSLYRMAQGEENIAIVSMVRSEQRDAMFNWVGDIYTQQTYLWKLKVNSHINVSTKEELSNYRVVVTKDGIDEQIFTSHYGLNENSMMYSITHPILRFLMVLNQRADLFSDNPLALKWNLKKFGYEFSDLEQVMTIPEMGSQLSMAFSKQTDLSLVSDYKKALKTIKRNGTYQKIVNKWSGSSELIASRY